MLQIDPVDAPRGRRYQGKVFVHLERDPFAATDEAPTDPAITVGLSIRAPGITGPFTMHLLPHEARQIAALLNRGADMLTVRY